MASNYCGKSCEACTYKEQLNCPGCEQGPGNSWTGTCKLAQCCDDKGHENCTTCGHCNGCRLLQSKHEIPKERLREIEYENLKNERIAKMVPKLSKWLPILFWTAIVSIVADFFTEDVINTWLPSLYYLATGIVAFTGLFYGVILLLISSESKWYKKAGMFGIIAPAVSLISAILIVMTESPILLLGSIASLVLAVYSEYNEYKGHAEVLAEVDPELSEKWDKLWKWTLYVYGALIGGIILTILIPVLGVLLTLAASIGALVVGVLKLVYLYRTAETFKYIKVN